MTKRPWWLLPPGRLNPIWWVPIGAGVLLFDYFVGPSPMFPVIYAIPVILAAWYSGRVPSLVLALTVPILRLALLIGRAPQDIAAQEGATLLRAVVILFMGLWFARLGKLERDLDRQVKVLEGLLPICSYCKSIRNESGAWEQLEGYISRKSEAEFSHGMCPSCAETHYPGMMDASPGA